VEDKPVDTIERMQEQLKNERKARQEAEKKAKEDISGLMECLEKGQQGNLKAQEEIMECL
jgi:Skp family chaperone for outer membrane proteins